MLWVPGGHGEKEARFPADIIQAQRRRSPLSHRTRRVSLTCFKQQHLCLQIGRKPHSHNTARCASAAHNVTERRSGCHEQPCLPRAADQIRKPILSLPVAAGTFATPAPAVSLPVLFMCEDRCCQTKGL